MSDHGLRDRLLAESEEYRRLDAQHHEYEAQLAHYADKPVLTDDEQIQETTLKKKKLHVKDRMEAIARSARENVATS
ncbi:MAG TPA: YdcH family protein [Vicinamibacteria bacterium]|nr:YdcH family protein [Vicinamibacteria bacterium]